MTSANQLQGKVCLITGASKGIGRSIAERFANEGAIVYANARNQGEIDDWAKEYAEISKATIIPVYFDVTDYVSVKENIMMIYKKHQKIDVLINNAGMVTYELIGMIQLDSLRKMFEINVIAVIQLIQIVSRLMTKQKKGSIINISSIVGVKGVKGQMAYSSTKGAVVALTKSSAKELAPHNIRVNSIAPGLVDTERFRAVFQENFKNRISDIGMGRLAQPVDIANACVFLASDQSEYISGQILGVDGSTII